MSFVVSSQNNNTSDSSKNQTRFSKKKYIKYVAFMNKVIFFYFNSRKRKCDDK